MFQYLPNIIFALLLGTSTYFAVKNFGKIRKNILLGKKKKIEGNIALRLKNMLLIAFGQKKMFDRPIAALLHLCVYVGFVVVNIEMLEIVVDGLFGTHRVLMGMLGSMYNVVINLFEIMAVLVIAACVVFLIRRNVLKINRLSHIDLKSWPLLDANIILLVEILLMVAFITMNAADLSLQSLEVEHYTPTGSFVISNLLTPIFTSSNAKSLIWLERASWWTHICGVFLFLNYIPFSKHLHIILAFPNTYFANLNPKGQSNNMPEITKEVKIMLGMPDADNSPTEVKRFGAKDATDLSWINLLNAYTCTECGRCTSVCPANLTGKTLSPRKIMMDTRDRLEEIGANLDKKIEDDGKSLLNDYITHEELLACTTCNACVEACPVNINPLEIITELRRYKIMEESQAPQSWNMMFQNIETNFAPWKFSPSDRYNWAQ